jgi:hypothetical protein
MYLLFLYVFVWQGVLEANRAHDETEPPGNTSAAAVRSFGSSEGADPAMKTFGSESSASGEREESAHEELDEFGRVKEAGRPASPRSESPPRERRRRHRREPSLSPERKSLFKPPRAFDNRELCRQFQRGECARGPSCRYSHGNAAQGNANAWTRQGAFPPHNVRIAMINLNI